MRPRRFALGAPERLGHPHELVPLRFRDQARERQQLAALLAREAREMRAVRLDGAQHTDASLDVVLGERVVRDAAGIGLFHGAHCMPAGKREVACSVA